MTRSEAGKLVAMLMAAYPSQSVRTTEATTRLYEHFLLDLEAAAASEAIHSLISGSKWMPTVAEIRERVFEIEIEAKPPELAWAEVRREIARVGIYGRPAFDDPCIELAVASLGWRAICDAKSGDWTLRAQFVRAYQAAFDKLKRTRDTERLLAEASAPRRIGKGGPEHLSSLLKKSEEG